MSTMMLERVETLKGMYAAAENLKADSEGCTLMVPQADTIALIKERPDLQEAAMLTVNALKDEKWVKSIEVEATIDHDSGEKGLTISVIATVDGKEARQLLQAFLQDRLPESARKVESDITFCVIRERAA